jgi:hypothetical protein
MDKVARIIRALTPIAAILTIGALEGIALSRDMDGALFGLAVAAISGLGGYELKAVLSNRRQK